MSIGLLSERQIRDQLQEEIDQHIQDYLDKGGKIEVHSTQDARFWHYQTNGAEAYRKGLTINKDRMRGALDAEKGHTD